MIDNVKAKTYYQILELNNDANDEQIKFNYRKLAKQYHPDLNKDPNAEGQFKAIQQAYEVLSEQSKRTNYDAYLKIIELVGQQAINELDEMKVFNERYDYQEIYEDLLATKGNWKRTIAQNFSFNQTVQPKQPSRKKSIIAIVVVVITIIIIFNLAYKIKI